MARRFSKGNRGTGMSGVISMDRPGQEILERSSLFVGGASVEAWLVMGIPAFGRTVDGKHAEAMFFTELQWIIRSSLYFGNLDRKALYQHIQVVEDADFLRE